MSSSNSILRDAVYLEESVLESPDSAAQDRNFSLLLQVPCVLLGPLMFQGQQQGAVIGVEVGNERDIVFQLSNVIAQFVQL